MGTKKKKKLSRYNYLNTLFLQKKWYSMNTQIIPDEKDSIIVFVLACR